MTAINTAKGDKTLTYTTVEDTEANLATDAATNSGEGTFTKDKAVTLTDEASAELTAINTANGDKTLTYTTVEDTAANLATDAATNW